ncbi:MAG: single-stranded DNA-binding protein, partial [Pseudolysinimonas sp.]
VRDWSTDEKKGTNVEIDVEALGHDLTWGTAQFTRSTATAVAEADDAAAATTDADAQSATDTDTDSFGEADGDAPVVAPEQEAAALSTPF